LVLIDTVAENGIIKHDCFDQICVNLRPNMGIFEARSARVTAP
jgi:hypothetical protein